MSTTRPLTGPLLEAGSRIPPRSTAWLRKRFQTYGIERCAVYIDHTSMEKDLLEVSRFETFWTFDATLEGATFQGKRVKLMGLDWTLPECDGWLVASTSRAAAFTLAKALLENGKEDQVITRLYGGQTTQISAYMDFFSGDSETKIYISHYYDRIYRVSFPLDLRYTIHTCDGSIVRAGQVVIPPGGIRVFDSSDMGLSGFEGYFRVELEVENLQTRVQPFIHFWADYISEAGICRNHQSGWSPWPADTVFNRGYLPLSPDLEAVACFYNENDTEVTPRALLHFERNGREHTAEREASPVPARFMSLQSMTELFADVDCSGANAAYVLLTCDKPLHRPNYYIARRGTRQFVDTYHQTGGMACHWALPSYNLDAKQLRLFARHRLDPWAIRIPVLPARFNLHAHYGLLSPTLASNTDFIYEVIDHEDRTMHQEPVKLTGASPIFFNIAEYLERVGVTLDKGGFFCLKPDWMGKETLSKSCLVVFGYKHPEFPSLATSFKGSPAETNLPFYLTARLPNVREYPYSPLQLSNHFAPGMVDDAYDSLLIVTYNPLSRRQKRIAHYRLEIYDSRGRMYIVHRELQPLSFHAFWLSELVREAGADPSERYFTVWVKCPDIKLKPYHGLYRRADHALSLDDASEGTLQREPMIGGLKYEDIKDNDDLLELLGVRL